MKHGTFLRILMLFLAIVFMLAMALGFISCRAVKDQKAVERVLGNDDLTAKVGQRINKAPDTVTRVVDHVVHDTLPIKTFLNGAVQVGPNPFVFPRPIDTVLSNGTRVVVSPTGISATAKVRTITKTVTDRA